MGTAIAAVSETCYMQLVKYQVSNVSNGIGTKSAQIDRAFQSPSIAASGLALSGTASNCFWCSCVFLQPSGFILASFRLQQQET